MDDFLKLGNAIYIYNKDLYKLYRVDILLYIFIEFGHSSTSINRESSKVLSRKRNTLEIGSNVSKRARTAI
jgi:hypothetical protein